MAETKLAQAKREFELPAKLGRVAVLNRLKNMRNLLHPDTTGGAFASKEQEARYHALNECVSSIEAQPQEPRAVALRSSTALILENQKQLLEVLEADRRHQREISLQAERRRLVESAGRALAISATAPLRRTKLAAWSVGGIALAVVALKEPLSLIGDAYGAASMSAASAAVMFVAAAFGFLGVMIQMSEQREAEAARMVVSDDGIGDLLGYTMAHDTMLYRDQLNHRDFAAPIRKYMGVRDPMAVEAASKAIIAQLEERNLLVPITTRSIAQQYELTEELREEAYNGKHRLEAEGRLMQKWRPRIWPFGGLFR